VSDTRTSDTRLSDARTSEMRVTGESAIHDLGYRRYEGARVGSTGAWRSLFWQGFRAMFGMGRTAKAKVIPVFVFVVTMGPVFATLSAHSVSQGVVPIRYGLLVGQQLILFVLFVAAQAPETLSRDQQHQVLPLILTRDVTRAGYASARFASIVSAVFLMALAPLLLLYIGQIGASSDPTAAFDRMGSQIGPVLAQAALTALCIGGIGAALAAWTPRRAYATAAIIGGFLVAAAVASGMDDIVGMSRRTAELIDPVRSLRTQAMLFFGEKTRAMELRPPMSLWWYAALMTGISAVSAGILWLRIQRVRA
jgi:ABC-2 type transport system permease protein